MNYQDWIIRDPNKCGGWPFLKGTEIPLKTVLEHLELGDSVENIAKTYPGMAEEGVRAVIAFTASFTGIELAKTLSAKPDNSSSMKSLHDLKKKMKRTD